MAWHCITNRTLSLARSLLQETPGRMLAPADLVFTEGNATCAWHIEKSCRMFSVPTADNVLRGRGETEASPRVIGQSSLL